ncbi:MAG: hypothetical protein JNN15_09220 [Blastocatellia bacterium]|nr:hypothetical protein [Blastocatellia bacterium]
MAQLGRYKKSRFGQRLVEASRIAGAFKRTYIVFGGTGAVGGTAIMKMLEIFEEMMLYTTVPPQDSPTIVVTGLTKEEIRSFSARLFDYYESFYGKDFLPKHINNRGYKTVSGIVIDLHRMSVNPELPGLANLARHTYEERLEQIRSFLAGGNLSFDSSEDEKFNYLSSSIKSSLKRPFTEFLQDYNKQHKRNGRFRAVIVGIPLASVAAYHLSNLETICKSLGISSYEKITDLKRIYLTCVRDDLAYIRNEMAEEVIAAHTTAVGGMYDEGAEGERTIRLGFAHSALDERLRDKQIFAEQLHQLYAECGIKMLVTAAAIGIDAIINNESLPVQSGLLRAMRETSEQGYKLIPEEDLRRGKVKVYPPLTIHERAENEIAVSFEKGQEYIPKIQVRSGENGRFSVPNTDALYRVMRVASASELGLVLAEEAIVGDDPELPWFVNNTCYYTETENARLVFDFLSQPQLFEAQISGLDVKSYQDLGSAKHQAELHMLGLAILLHRLRTFDADAIPAQVSLSTFNPREFFEQYSKPLFFEDLITWELEQTCRDFVTLVTATEAKDLESIKHLSSRNYQSRNEAFSKVMNEVIKYVYTVVSLGSPIIFNKKGETFILVGSYIAPLDILMKTRNEIQQYISSSAKAIGVNRAKDLALLKEYFYCNNGFIDLRPIAVVSTARNLPTAAKGGVHVYQSSEALKKHLRALPPYSYFATSGLVAFLERMKGLYAQVTQFSLGLGTLNDYRAQIPLSSGGNHYVVPGVVEAIRQAAEGLEKNTGTDRLHGQWGYFRREPPERA